MAKKFELKYTPKAFSDGEREKLRQEDIKRIEDEHLKDLMGEYGISDVNILLIDPNQQENNPNLGEIIDDADTHAN